MLPSAQAPEPPVPAQLEAKRSEARLEARLEALWASAERDAPDWQEATRRRPPPLPVSLHARSSPS